MASLKRSGLVRSVRGAGGGYELTRPPSHIRVSEVVHVLEGSLGLVGCVEDKSFCGRVDRCPVRSVWVDLSKTVENALSGMTLQDIVARASESNATPATYNI
jgi:Rrf2 family protein